MLTRQENTRKQVKNRSKSHLKAKLRMYFAHLSFLHFRMESSKNRIIHIADHKKYLGFSQQFPNGILNFGSLWQALYLRGPKWRCLTVLHHVAEATEWLGRFVRTMSNRPRCKMTFAICPQSRPQEWHLATRTHVRPGKKKNAKIGIFMRLMRKTEEK